MTTMMILPVLLAGCAMEDNCLPPDETGAMVAFQQVAPYTESLWKFGRNTDESKVGNYVLPEIRSKTAAEWESVERPAVLQAFKDTMYGEMPPAPDRLRLELLAEKDNALDGLAIRKEIRIHCEMDNGRRFYFDMLLYVPKRVIAPPPVFVGLNFSGNQCNTPETDVRMTRSMYQDFAGDLHMKPCTARGKNLKAWNYTEAMKRGYAVATAAYGEICPDHLNGLKKSGFTLFYEPEDLRSDYEVPFAEIKSKKWQRRLSLVGAWAWGLSRMLDALEREPLVDAGKAMVIGHSRNGKAALWAGACDQRFAAVISNNSGCGGAKLTRRNFGETLKILYWEKRAWLCGGIIDYVDRVEALPVDQHQLLALVAPRNLYVASATLDLNADPKGEFLAAQAASPVWRLYGKSGLDDAKMPPPDQTIGGDVSYHIRTGKHGILPWDWQQYYDFADRAFKK